MQVELELLKELGVHAEVRSEGHPAGRTITVAYYRNGEKFRQDCEIQVEKLPDLLNEAGILNDNSKKVGETDGDHSRSL